MNKKSIIIICIIIIILIIFGISYNQITHTNTIKIGDSYFSIPNNFKEGELTKNGDVNITNGTNSLGIVKCNGTLESNIEEYNTYLEKQNFDSVYTTFNINDITINKIHVENNTQTTHYWFELGKNTYSMYSWDDKYNNLDTVIKDFILSQQ